jgi:prepilin-type N-terminal cleavage/methylation domain-containing protein
MMRGFTLIELSIVLVIIGLITAAILVGQDLISAAAVRAQISQIEKYNSAVNTFHGKYGYLPGDIPNGVAVQYGFIARDTTTGSGDGDGIIEGTMASSNAGDSESCGETIVLWRDLSAASLIDGGFTTAAADYPSCNALGNLTSTSTPGIGDILPKARIGQGNYIYAYSGGCCNYAYGVGWTSNNVNYLGISQVVQNHAEGLQDNFGLTVAQAYSIDQKIDDGLPQTGKVIAQYVGYVIGGLQASIGWAGTQSYANYQYSPSTATTAPSPTTCYDNSGGVDGTPQHYSMEINNGAGMNCSLSFQFQ